jgi:methylated-DNA-[protein]-cysteine S-methyltransferase
MMNVKRYDSPLGALWLAAQNDALVGAWFEGQKHFPHEMVLRENNADDTVLTETAAQLAAYFDAKLKTFALPLAPRGTAFQQDVWRALQTLDFGIKSTYGAISAHIKKPNASRAVGAAVGRNPISIIIPCHRVVGSAGALTGYAGGLDRKRALLTIEGIA